jgi:hypothetical protein
MDVSGYSFSRLLKTFNKKYCVMVILGSKRMKRHMFKMGGLNLNMHRF